MAAQHFPENDPRYHTANMKKMLENLAIHAQEDVLKIKEPRAQALFETTNAVLRGL
jgi:hypothetical protein